MYNAICENDKNIIIKAIGNRILSNCYYSYHEIIEKIKKQEIHLLSRRDIVLLIQEENEINKMYYFVNGDIENGIEQEIYNDLCSEMEEYQNLVTNFIARNSCDNFDIIKNLRFKSYKQYFRYHLVAEKVKFLEPKEVAAYAETNDINAIYRLLYNTFDILSDHLPSKKELHKFIEAGQIIKICKGCEIAGVLIFEKQGAKSHLRALCVNPIYRNMAIGYSLMLSYIKLVRQETKSFFLWVESTNNAAIQLYKKMGYEPDGLTEYIFLYEK